MTDDELTELAQRAWPGADPMIVVEGTAAAVSLFDGSSLLEVHHERAREMLAAALLVIASDMKKVDVWYERAFAAEQAVRHWSWQQHARGALSDAQVEDLAEVIDKALTRDFE